MALKGLLVHVDDSERCAHRLTAACRIAHEFAAHLAGVYLVQTPELSPTIAALLPDEIVEQQLRTTGAAQELAEARFYDASQRASLVTIEWRAPAGDPLQALAAHARAADLSVVGQPDPRHAGDSFDDRLVSAALLSTGRPALVIPHKGLTGPVGRTVLVAWDTSRECARAVADALPILARARRVIVVSVGRSEDERSANEQAAAHVDAYLRRHSVIGAIRQVDRADGDITRLLLSQAREAGADLIVMGAYGHAPLRERVLGGVTRSMLENMTIPVLMSH